MIKLTQSIAVISDIHIGTDARSKDLCPTANDKLRDEDFLARFKRYVNKRPIKADYLVVAGDITSSAKATEFSHASEVIATIARVLGVKSDAIFFVPGNHDIDWNVLRADPDNPQPEFRWEQRYDPIIRQPKLLFTKRLKAAKASFFEAPFSCIWDAGALLVAGLNSAWHDCPDREIHNGKAAQLSINWLDEQLAKIPVNTSAVRVFIVHHHPIQYSEPYPDDDDFSIMTNAENLLNVLRKHKFDILIHGHKHVPRFETHLVQSDHAIHVLGAGSFCANLDSKYSGSITNQFHLINLKGRISPSSRVVGNVESWAFLGPNDWHPSTETHTGIHDVIGFGYFLSAKDVEARVFTLVSKHMKAKPVIKWEDLTNLDIGLRYIHPRTVKLVLTQVSANMGIEFVGDSIQNYFLIR